MRIYTSRSEKKKDRFAHTASRGRGLKQRCRFDVCWLDISHMHNILREVLEGNENVPGGSRDEKHALDLLFAIPRNVITQN